MNDIALSHARTDKASSEDIVKIAAIWKGEHLQFPRVGDTAYRLQEVKEGEAP